jgi:hypothetical protein
VLLPSLLVAATPLAAPDQAHAQTIDQLCDSSFENCRTPLLDYIRAEDQGIDVGMWFMEDSRFSTELIRRAQAGVPVRILMDTRSNVQHPAQPAILDALADAGIPMRRRTASGIEHWKIMNFEEQGVLYFGSANFSSDGFVPITPYVNYVDETIYFTNNVSLVNSFKTRFDDAWISSAYTWFANPVSPLARRHAIYPVDPELNIPPGQDFINRTAARLDAENERIDVMMYRIDDSRATNAMVSAHNRGVPIRLIVDPAMYRDESRYPIAFHFDRLYAAGIPMKVTVHQGINHGKLTLLHGQDMTIFGSSNWTTPSANLQHENNLFTTKSLIFSYFEQYFLRRWNNTAPGGVVETGPFVPEPPGQPVNTGPANGAVGVATTGINLSWLGGYWGQYYDIYFGTSSNPPLFAENRFLGPAPTTPHSFLLPTLAAGTTYYWKIVSKTAANLSRSGPVWSFTTTGAPPPPPPGAETVVVWTANIPSGSVFGDWTRVTDATAAGGAALHNPNQGRAKVAPALASPANYFEATFDAIAGTPYHFWVRMKAQSNSTSNDSVHVQFNDSVDAVGTPLARIGTSGSLEPVLQNGPGGPVPSGWGWTENGWGPMGPHVYFAASGTHTLRVQMREDGPTIDQIVLSPADYLSTPPGGRTNDTTILPENDGSGGEPPPPPPPNETIVLWTADVAAGDVHGNWERTIDGTAAGGFSLWNSDLEIAKISPALASPPHYFEASFTAEAGRPYHLWIRGLADGNSLANDSVHVQFSGAVNSSGQPIMRIGSTASAEPVLQAGPGGAAPSGWGWTDNGWGAPGTPIYFATTGVQTVRIQQREDGIAIDQIVLSPDVYLDTAPGARRDDMTILPKSGGSEPPPPPPPPSSEDTIVLWPGTAGAATLAGNWQRTSETSAAGGFALWNPNANAAKIAPALTSPSHHFTMTFEAEAGRAYHVWLRMRAEGDSYANDSVHVQFSDSQNATGTPFARIGTTSSLEVVLQDGPGGATPHGWGWTENGWGALGPHVYFATSGTKTLRIQQREDGPLIDQIVISPDAYLTSSPGARRDDTVILEQQQP